MEEIIRAWMTQKLSIEHFLLTRIKGDERWN